MQTPPEPEPDRQTRLDALLLEALELPEAERAAFAAARCGADTALRDELLDLLDCERHAALPAGETRAAFTRTRIALDRPTLEIPGYRIESVIGSGGMGVVYRAIQEPLGRPVALKVVHPLDAHGDEARRLEREAEFLARLQHPGIAQIHEAGILSGPAGDLPWFAMELIDGCDPITWSQRTGASVRERVQLCIALCDAIQHAHDRGVIHRDLKPGNILVTTSGTDPARPRILDFGIARDVAGGAQVGGTRTRTGHLVGTLPYMSPEQVRGRGELDGRVDVYALGVLLYELLTGRVPFDFQGRSLTELTRDVLEVEPDPLSAHDPALRGDLEIICATALEKDADRRYATPQLLADDLQRYLRDEPIRARPPSRWTRVRRFTRRHRALVAITSSTFGALLLGLTAVLWIATEQAAQAIRERGLRAEADQAATAARRHLYFSQMAATSLAVDSTGVHSTARQLARWLPAEGRPDLRGWEWFVLRGASRDADRVWPAPGCVEHLAGIPGSRAVLAAGAGFCELLDPDDGTAVQLPDAPLSQVRAVRCDPTGRFAAAAGRTGLRIWDLQDRALLRRVDLPSPGSSVALAPDRPLVVALGFQGWLQVHDWRTGALVHERAQGIHGDSSVIDFSPDGRFLAVSELGGRILILDATTWADHARIPHDAGVTQALRFSHDGRRLATGHADGTVRIWDTANWQAVEVFERHDHWVNALSWSADDRFVVSGGNDHALRCWSLDTGQQLHSMVGHENQILATDFGADGALLVSGCRDAEIRVWDFARRAAQLRLGRPRRPTAAFSIRIRWLDAERLVVDYLDQRALWDLRTRTAETSTTILAPGRERSAPDGRHYARLGVSNDRLYVRSQTDPDRQWEITGLHARHSFPGWHPSGERLAVPCRDGIYLWEVGAAEASVWIEGFVSDVPPYWSADGRFFAAVGHQAITLFDGVSGRPLHSWPRELEHTPTDGVFPTLAGDRVALGDSSGRVHIWSIDPDVPYLGLSGHDQTVLAVAWSPDGNRLATGSRDRTVRIWDPTDGQLAATFRLSQSVAEIAWSPSGDCLAAATIAGEVFVWDARPGRAVASLPPDPTDGR